VGMRVFEFAHDPRIDGSDVDAKFFMELPRQRMRHGFPVLELAAGKLPVVGVRLAGWAAGEEESAVGADQYSDRDVNDGPAAHRWVDKSSSRWRPA